MDTSEIISDFLVSCQKMLAGGKEKTGLYNGVEFYHNSF